MKKLFLTFLSVLFVAQTAFAANIEVLPTMSAKTTVQDRVWVGTFQLVWNDLMERVALGAPIRFSEGTPDSVNELNEKLFTTEDISSKSYYKHLGKITKNTKKNIEKAIKKKFNETSDILDTLDLTPSNHRYIAYAMLKKDFKFEQPFNKLGQSNFKDNQTEFFGITKESSDDLRNTVEVLFYNSNEYAVKLNTLGQDEVYIYRTSTTKPFNLIYEDMLKKQARYDGKKNFSDIDELKVPNLKFFEEKRFAELEGKRIKGTQAMIETAIESIKFNMDNEGVELKSEAAIIAKLTSAAPSAKPEPRYFYFNDTFVLFLKEKNKEKPYFALRVYDISNYTD